MCESHTSPWKQYPCEGFILIVIFVLLCILVPLQAAHVRVHTCVCICAHLAFAVLGVWQPPFPPDQGIPRAPGPVSAVGETELLPSARYSAQEASSPGASVCSAAICMKLFKEGNRDRQHL